MIKRFVALGAMIGLLAVQVLITQAAGATTPGANGRLAFELYSEGNDFQGQVATMTLEGVGRRVLTPPAPGEPPAPEWSPDGRRIAFVRCSGEESSCNIWTVRRDGSHERQVTQCKPEECFGNLGPAWHPDGRHIVFERDQRNAQGANRPGLFLIRTDGSGMRRLTSARTFRDISHSEPQYSPDGRWIVFTRVIHESDEPNRLFIVRADGTNIRPLTPPKLDSDNPDWSPDGHSIVFTGHPRVPGAEFAANVYTIHPNGTGIRQLTHGRADFVFNFFASWSPDGRRIVFDRVVFNRLGESLVDDVFTMNRRGHARRRVTHTRDRVFEIRPDWGPRVR